MATCTSPRTVGFYADGKTICWSSKKYSKEYATFQLPCGKCLACRLEYARQWAVRCVHEAQMHEKNSFITLTYDDEHLSSPFLIYEDFQKFAKRLRRSLNSPIGYFVTGEYGEDKKRPHWHACIFGWSPSDGVYKYSNHRGDKNYSSETLTKLWGKGTAEYGEVTFDSAGYCARYAAKKIVHSPNGKVKESDFHPWQPISKKSSKQAIGKKWLERYWPDVFLQGHVVLKDGTTCSIPRYYEKWLKENHPQEWLRYVTGAKLEKTNFATAASARVSAQETADNLARSISAGERGVLPSRVRRSLDARKIILDERHKRLQQHLKIK